MKNRIKAAARWLLQDIVGDLLDWKVLVGAGLPLIAVAIGIIRGWVSGVYELQGWFFACLVGMSISSTTLAAAFGMRAWQLHPKRKRKFSPIVIPDSRLPLEWRITRPQDEWLHDYQLQNHSHEWHEQILAGPFHARCNAALEAEARRNVIFLF